MRARTRVRALRAASANRFRRRRAACRARCCGRPTTAPRQRCLSEPAPPAVLQWCVARVASGKRNQKDSARSLQRCVDSERLVDANGCCGSSFSLCVCARALSSNIGRRRRTPSLCELLIGERRRCTTKRAHCDTAAATALRYYECQPGLVLRDAAFRGNVTWCVGFFAFSIFSFFQLPMSRGQSRRNHNDDAVRPAAAIRLCCQRVGDDASCLASA